MSNNLGVSFIDDLNRQQNIPPDVSRKKLLSYCVAAAVMGASLIAAQDVNAATKKASKNKASSVAAANDDSELARLKAQLQAVQQKNDQLQQENESLKQGVAIAPGAEPAIASEPATAEAAEVVAQEANTDNLGEVVVRSRPKLEKLHNINQSVSVVSGKQLDQELALDLGAITRRASNVQFNQANTRTASLSIRGLGKRTTAETQDPSVRVVVDETNYGLTGLANFSFYDVDTVEVTRGPRGTEGGLTASSGKVKVTSRAPTFTPTAEYSATYGEREALILKGALGGGVIDDLLAWRGSFIVDKGRGFYENKYDSNYSLYNRDRLSGRVQFLLTPTSNITAKIIAHFEPKQPQLQNGLTFYHNGQPLQFANGALTDPNGGTARSKLNGFVNTAGVTQFGPRALFQNRGFNWSDYIGGEQRNSVWFDHNAGQTVSNQGASVKVDWDVADHILTSTTAVHEYFFDAHNDEGTPFDISLDGGGGVNYSQFTQEFNVKNKPGGFIDYRAGLIGMKTHDDINSKTGWGADAGAWFATNNQYNALERNNTANRGAGIALLKDTLNDARKFGNTESNTLSGAIFGESDLHFNDAFTLTPGLRVTRENRKTTDEVRISNNGSGEALNPVAVRGVQLNGFDSITTASATTATDKANGVNYGALKAGNSTQQLQLADSVANRYFGKTITSTAGAAYASLTPDQQILVGNAKTIRSNQIGQLYKPVTSDYDDTLFTAQLTPSYKFNDDVTAYLTWQYGEKSGAPININGVSSTVKPENTHALELGFKTFWLEKAIIVNADVFVMDIHNYQQTVQVVNEFETEINRTNGNPQVVYVGAQGNVKKVRVHGVELDSVFNVIPNLSFRLNGAYNLAKYIDFNNAGKPDELAYLTAPYIDFSNKTLSGANKWSFVVGAEYTKPVFERYNFHTSFNTNFQSGYNTLDNLSFYGKTTPRSLTDFTIGVGTKNNVLDVSFIAKNLFNNNEHESGWNSYSPNPYPAWFGVQLSGKI